MILVGTVQDAEVEFRESQTPLCESASGISEAGGPVEGVVINAYREKIFFKLQPEEK